MPQHGDFHPKKLSYQMVHTANMDNEDPKLVNPILALLIGHLRAKICLSVTLSRSVKQPSCKDLLFQVEDGWTCAAYLTRLCFFGRCETHAAKVFAGLRTTDQSAVGPNWSCSLAGTLAAYRGQRKIVDPLDC